MINLIFVGDVMLGRSFDKVFKDLKPQTPFYLSYPWGNALPYLQNSDGVIANLETTITTNKKKWKKAFNYKLNPEYKETLKIANIFYCSLANNHILDFMNKGLKNTIKNLDSIDIKHAGAGEDIESAQKPVITKIKNKKFAFFSAADHYHYWEATKNKPGIWYIPISNGYNRKWKEVKQKISKIRSKVDYIIFSLHWGGNYVDEIKDNFIEFGHFLIDNGVDIIHGHSAHHTLPYEKYKEGLIFYSLGDFIDDYAVNKKYNSDIGVMINIEFSDKIKIREIVKTKIKNYQVNKLKN